MISSPPTLMLSIGRIYRVVFLSTMNIAIEVIIFKVKAGVSDSQLQTAALAVTPPILELMACESILRHV